MISFFLQVLSVIGLLLSTFAMIITSMVQLVANIPVYLSFLLSAIGVLPTFVTQFAVVGITLTALLFIMGKNEK